MATVQQIDPGFLKKSIPFLLLGILCYTIFTPKLGAEEAMKEIGGAKTR